MIRVEQEDKPDIKWNGEYYYISSYKPHPSDVEHYGAKRMYYVHAVYKYEVYFLGRYFSLKKARDAIKDDVAKNSVKLNDLR